MAYAIKTKRIYEEPDEADGYRVLVDRMWPRGVSKERAKLDEWAKQIAPSKALCDWFGHKAERYLDFQGKYIDELDENPDAEEFVKKIAGELDSGKQVTLLYAAKSKMYNNALALEEWLNDAIKELDS
ncbi:MAG: DUF488 domain-containing protein [Anaerovoracaceae bacterium]|jgi:uncharacterized protein YeaO (DUF488 family)